MKAFFKKLWGIIKKFWFLLIVPLSAFIVRFFIKKNKETKNEIKELKSDIKTETKKLDSQKETVEQSEQNLLKTLNDSEDLIKEQSESQENRKTELKDILPNL